jgi:phosphohistidine swiveling domain-containing protein
MSVNKNDTVPVGARPSATQLVSHAHQRSESKRNEVAGRKCVREHVQHVSADSDITCIAAHHRLIGADDADRTRRKNSMTTLDDTHAETNWEAPGPGPWSQARAHFPASITPTLQTMYPYGGNRGFAETFADWGVLLDGITSMNVNGFQYSQIVPFDAPGPEGQRTAEYIATEIERRAGVAAAAFENRIWRNAMRRWDIELKPASIVAHRALADIDLAALDTEGLRVHLHRCVEHLGAMWYQHHRFNGMVLIPVGDFVLHAAQWTGRPAASLFAVFDGWSPVSSVLPPEMEPAIDALRADPGARALLAGDAPAAQRFAELSRRVPAVAAYVRAIGYRLAAGFDMTNPTIAERPEIVLGRLQAALSHDPTTSCDRADVFAAELRAEVPEEHQTEFDGLLTEARHVYRLRDERGLYSDSPAVGLMRLALIELGRRLNADGRINFQYDTLDLWPAEIDGLLDGDPNPTAKELTARVAARKAATAKGAPALLGPVPPPPPSLDQLPPPLARVMAAFGFVVNGVTGEGEGPAGDATTIIGIAGSAGFYEGPARVVRNFDDLWGLEDGEVLITPATGESFNSFLHFVGAIVTDHGSFASHAAIMGREMGFPTVVGCVDATRRIATGTRVRVDGTAGTVTICH